MADDRIFGKYHNWTVEVLEARTHPRTGEPKAKIRLFYHGGAYEDMWVPAESLHDVRVLRAEDVVKHHAMKAQRRAWMNPKGRRSKRQSKSKKNPVTLRSIMARATR